MDVPNLTFAGLPGSNSALLNYTKSSPVAGKRQISANFYQPLPIGLATSAAFQQRIETLKPATGTFLKAHQHQTRNTRQTDFASPDGVQCVITAFDINTPAPADTLLRHDVLQGPKTADDVAIDAAKTTGRLQITKLLLRRPCRNSKTTTAESFAHPVGWSSSTAAVDYIIHDEADFKEHGQSQWRDDGEDEGMGWAGTKSG